MERVGSACVVVVVVEWRLRRGRCSGCRGVCAWAWATEGVRTAATSPLLLTVFGTLGVCVSARLTVSNSSYETLSALFLGISCSRRRGSNNPLGPLQYTLGFSLRTEGNEKGNSLSQRKSWIWLGFKVPEQAKCLPKGAKSVLWTIEFHLWLPKGRYRPSSAH